MMIQLNRKNFYDEIPNITREAIPSLVVDGLGLRRVAEIGVSECGFTRKLLTSQLWELVGVDIWMETGIRSENDFGPAGYSKEQLERQLLNAVQLSNTDKRFGVYRQYSSAAALLFRNGYFDMVYIDADHTYEAVTADLDAWWPKIKPGGVLAGHDYVEKTLPNGVQFGVVKAVQEFAKKNRVKVAIDREPDFKDWFILKV